MTGMGKIPGIGKSRTEEKKAGDLTIKERWESDEDEPLQIRRPPTREDRAPTIE